MTEQQNNHEKAVEEAISAIETVATDTSVGPLQRKESLAKLMRLAADYRDTIRENQLEPFPEKTIEQVKAEEEAKKKEKTGESTGTPAHQEHNALHKEEPKKK